MISLLFPAEPVCATHTQVTPERGVTGYIHDKTQGPACSIGAGPATVYRNYFAPVPLPTGKTQIGQSDDHQIDNLLDMCLMLGNRKVASDFGQFYEVPRL